jgi:ribonucrease Y
MLSSLGPVLGWTLNLAPSSGLPAMPWGPMLADVTPVTAAAGGAGLFVIGLVIGVLLVRMLGGKSIADAKAEAGRLIESAKADAHTQARQIALDAEKAAVERKSKLDQELEGQRSELRETDRRLTKREDQIERREESLSAKDAANAKAAEGLKAREDKLVRREAEVEAVLLQQKDKLYELARLSKDEAKAMLLERVENDFRQEAAKVARKITQEAEEDAKKKAQEITLMAIQRYATEHTSESTVRAVAIPSDEMKGRIIGREGRNIRAIEKATGVDIIVDDTPGVIVVSCFDKVRQAVAVESLERLVQDGRMHPGRIEEVVEKVRGEVSERILKFGRDSTLEVNLRGIHPKVSEAMGKLAYRTSYGQNVLRHSVEVAFLCQIIADQLGLDGTLARRCGFLHDIGKAMDHEMEGGHPKIGMDFARQFGEKEIVLNAIGGHHGDIPSISFYTPIVMAADAVSSARPGARRESMERYVQRLTELQDIALSMPGVNEAHAIQAGREVRVMVDARRVNDDEAYMIAQKIAKRVSDEMTFPGEIKVTVLRETRAIEIAR